MSNPTSTPRPTSSISIPIPRPSSSAYALASPSSSTASSSTTNSPTSPSTPARSAAEKGKSKEPSHPASMSSRRERETWHRRQSWLGPSLQAQTHTTIDLASAHGGPPRLITCVRHSQGFDWNPDIFLPAYAARRLGGGGTDEREPERVEVEEVWVSDAEAEGMFPSDF